MRMTIDISEEFLREAKKQVTEEGVPLQSIVEAALRRQLADRGQQAGDQLRWRTERGHVHPAVDLDARDALFDLMARRR